MLQDAAVEMMMVVTQVVEMERKMHQMGDPPILEQCHCLVYRLSVLIVVEIELPLSEKLHYEQLR